MVLRSVLAAAILGAVVVGCASDAPVAMPTTSFVVGGTASPTGPRLWVRTPAVEDLSAPVEGTVRYDAANDCFLLDRNGVISPVVWPIGTSVRPSGPTVVSAAGLEIELGQYVAGAGGYLDVADSLRIPQACLRSGPDVAVFNADSSLRIVP